jgi:hypothetical protein
MAMNTKKSATQTEFEQLLECLKIARMAGDAPFAGLLEIAGGPYPASSDKALGPE